MTSTSRAVIFAILPADQVFAHESGKKRFNEAVTQLIADKDIWKWHEALVSLIDKGQLEQADEPLRIELTQERFGNLIAFRIGRSPKRFWCWEDALRYMPSGRRIKKEELADPAPSISDP
jgi:hypothetical protein